MGVRVALGLALLAAAACGERGQVTFSLSPPENPLFDPLDERVTDYVLKQADGTIVALASQGPTPGDRLPLGPLAVTVEPQDLTLSIMSGAELVGMARILDVAIRSGEENRYVAPLRKPLVFVGSALPNESDPMNQLQPSQILDGTRSVDLAPQAPALPPGFAAAAVTSDGRFLLAGRPGALAVVDTGTGKTIGELPIALQPTRIIVAPRDAAALVLDGVGGAALLVRDLAGLTANPAAATATQVALGGAFPRTAAFSPDGQRAYVLGGGSSADPCTAAAPPPNPVLIIGADAQLESQWTLPSFASDLTVDPVTGTVILSQSIANQVSTLDPSSPGGPVTPTRLLAATCPSAIALSGRQIFVVTSERDGSFDNAFTLRRASLDGGTAVALPFGGPLYEVAINDTSTPDGAVNLNLQLRPEALSASELAVTPDGNRAVFAARARYKQSGQHFQLLGFDCTTELDIVEYGLYSVDARSGTSSYDVRAQLVQTPSPRTNTPCITCLDLLFQLDLFCPSLPGDRPAGLAAIFGGP